ncbi:MAG: FGLLP motif-containing membrane protein [Candidatus Limnocylindrales bacterium]
MPEAVGSDLAVVGQSLLLALLFLLLAAFPGQLLNKTLEENYDEVVGWLTPEGRIGTRVRALLARFWDQRVGLLLFVILSALMYGFLSPEFGPTVESAASLIGILGGLAIVIAAFELPLYFFQRRMLNDRGRLRVQPMTLVVGIACVVISRIADFQPGYLYGLVAGYVFAKELSMRDEGRANAVTAVWMLLISLGAWLALPTMEVGLAGQPLLQTLVAAALATIFVGGLEGLLFELVPLRFLRGESVFAWHRGMWAILFLAAAFTFAHILLTPTSGYLGDTRSSPLVAAVILFVAFGIVSVAFWAYFKYRPARSTSAA